MAETPSPTPSGRLSKRTQIALAAFCTLVMLYSVVIAGQILLGVLACGFVVTAVVAYKLVGAFYRFVAATERIAGALESREGTGRSTGPNSPSGAVRAARSDDSRGQTDDASGDRSRDHAADRW
ncbi:hypothetical protein C474_21416 [Halogeometricum pallidum JCM 14848]|uniref:Uncharacterized protein n=1 Tax=Halogeometricum pallidum JCM 14848 TaxID=1227487 RepID=M0CUG8_HALPD|nr:hypothetical protein [Halogeometricum pallidum]ELZ26298.1 hypothetical protein C474_21416 [Halogeometricum pallidum JCM 14848]